MRIPPRSCFTLSGQKEGYADSQCDLKDCGNDECNNQNAGLFLKGHIEVHNSDKDAQAEAKPAVHKEAENTADSCKHGYIYGNAGDRLIRFSATQETAVYSQIHFISHNHKTALGISEINCIVNQLDEPVGRLQRIFLSVNEKIAALVFDGMVYTIGGYCPLFFHYVNPPQ